MDAFVHELSIADAELRRGSVIEARELSVAYGSIARLRRVSLAARARRVTAILGPSGCGKSTLLRALNRTLELIPGARRQGGTVLLDGIDIYADGVPAAQVRARVGLLHQKPTPFPMSIAENVLFGAAYHGMVGDRDGETQRLLERVGLWAEVKDRLGSPALRLSGGQQQRLCLARTLAVKPDVLLMDEPCSALDPRATAVIEALIHDLARDYAVVLVTHNLAQARRVADECAFMLDGTIIERGTRADVLDHPRHDIVRDFVTGRIG
jgi:phosphate transport system ATP-binding protein